MAEKSPADVIRLIRCGGGTQQDAVPLQTKNEAWLDQNTWFKSGISSISL